MGRKTLIEDPRTGEQVSLTELCVRYGLSRRTLDRRRANSLTGEDLIKPMADSGNARPKGSRKQPGRRDYIRRKPHTPEQRQEIAAELLQDPIAQLAAMPWVPRAAA